jgi:hypothetical protein
MLLFIIFYCLIKLKFTKYLKIKRKGIFPLVYKRYSKIELLIDIFLMKKKENADISLRVF